MWGDAFDWLTPFSVLCGFGVMVTYAALGCGWLIYKSEGALQRRARLMMAPLSWLLMFMIGIVSLWSAIGLPAISQRWFDSGLLDWFLPVPLLVVIYGASIIRSLRLRHEATPFLLTLALCFLGFTGLIISIWPHIVPNTLTIWGAASSPESQRFALVGTLILLPIILVYNAMQYRVFRGKTGELRYA